MHQINTGRDEFKLAVLGISLSYGLLCTIGYEKFTATSIKLFPGIGGRIFVGALAVGAAIALYGVLHGGIRGLLVERAGMLILAGMSLGYAAWVPAAIGTRGLGLLLFLGILVGGPAAVRVWRIYRWQRAIHREAGAP
jgi:hypothetical protein